MKPLTQEIFIGQPIEVDFACVDYDGLLHFGKAINPRYTYASERWRGFDKIGDSVKDSGFEPLTSIRIEDSIQGEKEALLQREEAEIEAFYCPACLAMFEEECICNELEEA